MSGGRPPLEGTTVLSLAGLGPVPFACGVLSDLGATVVRIERPSGRGPGPSLDRLGVRDCVVVEVDLKEETGAGIVGTMVEATDVLIEGFRPGVVERLGLGPVDVRRSNPTVVYARITGWGREGPYAPTAGHDINYLAVAGALGAIGDSHPIPPLNLVADYAGGALYAVVGILAALLGRAATGDGNVVDVAMVDGVGGLLGPIQQLRSAGLWTDRASSNLLDGRAPFYRTYRTADGRYIAVGALEPDFYATFVDGLGLDVGALPPRADPSHWDSLAAVFGEVIATRTRDEWARVFEGTDGCVSPVLTLAEASEHPHAVARASYVEHEGGKRPAPAPRMTGVHPRSHAQSAVSDTLVALGLTDEAATGLEASGSSYWV